MRTKWGRKNIDTREHLNIMFADILSIFKNTIDIYLFTSRFVAVGLCSI